MQQVMIEAEGLQKRYGEHLAVASVDVAVPCGRILGVLGPNGAGKSTTVRMLTTMTEPDGGSGRVGGLDVVRDAGAVRRIIGVTGQDATLDELLTGAQNLVLVGELSRMSHAMRRRERASCSSTSSSRLPPAAPSRPTRAGCAAASISPRAS